LWDDGIWFSMVVVTFVVLMTAVAVVVKMVVEAAEGV